MKMNLSLLLVLSFSSLLMIHAGPSFRGLQESTPVVLPMNTTTTSTNTTNNSTNTTATNTTRPASNPYAGYTQINVSNLNASWYNPAVYAAFRHGVNALVQTAIFQQRAPLAVYNVTKWVSAYYRNTNSGVSYKFNVELTNARGVKIAMNLTVNYNRRRNVNLLGAYNYRVTNIPRNSFPSDGYKFATPAQVHNNAVLKGALKFGAEWMVQWLVDKNKIPAQDLAYTMSGLSRAVYKDQRNGTSYRFQTQNVNAAGVNVDTNYTVFYNSANKNYSVTAYWYHGYNYSDSLLVNNTNLTNSTSNVTVQVDNSTVLTGVDNVTVVNDSTNVEGSSNEVVEETNSTVPVTEPVVDTNTTLPVTEPVVDTNTTLPVTEPAPSTNSTEPVTVPVPTPEPEPVPVPVPAPEPAAKVTVDISGVTAYVETETTTPLINYNRPAQN